MIALFLIHPTAIGFLDLRTFCHTDDLFKWAAFLVKQMICIIIILTIQKRKSLQNWYCSKLEIKVTLFFFTIQVKFTKRERHRSQVYSLMNSDNSIYSCNPHLDQDNRLLSHPRKSLWALPIDKLTILPWKKLQMFWSNYLPLFLLNCRSVWSILCISSLSYICIANIFCQSVAYLHSYWTVSFDKQKHLFLMRNILAIV